MAALELTEHLGLFARFWPAWVRIAALLAVAPLFGAPGVPVLLRFGLAFFLAAALTPTLPSPGMVDRAAMGEAPLTAGTLVALGLREALIGLLLGFFANLPFWAFLLGGQLVDLPLGFGLATVLDPQQEEPVPVVAQLHYVLGVLLFFLLGGDHLLILALHRSFQTFPPGTPGAPEAGAALALALEGLGHLFLLGFQIGVPAMAALFLADLALGLAVRAVPQLNVFFVGLPAKILIGLGVVLLSLPYTAGLIARLWGSESWWVQLLFRVAGAGPGGG